MPFDLKKSGESDSKDSGKFDLAKNKDKKAQSSAVAEGKKSFPFMWLILALVLIGGAIWFLTNKNTETNQTSNSIEKPINGVNANDSANLKSTAITINQSSTNIEKVPKEKNGTENPVTSSGGIKQGNEKNPANLKTGIITGERNSITSKRISGMKDRSSEKNSMTSSDYAKGTSKKDVASVSSETSKIIMNFAFNNADMSGSNQAIDELIKYLKENPNSKIRVIGHTDNIGEKGYNLTLSRKRAKVIYDYLITMGISIERLKYSGRGDQLPIANNDTEEGRTKNRRAEYQILNN